MPKEKAGKRSPNVKITKPKAPEKPKPTIPETLPPISEANKPIAKKQDNEVNLNVRKQTQKLKEQPDSKASLLDKLASQPVKSSSIWRGLGASKEGFVIISDVGEKKTFPTVEEAEEFLNG